jgi:2-hydroxychromene-2-carboxylate isomerase
MIEPTEVKVFFNFRSPYCYILSRTLASIFEDFHVQLAWRPLGGWSGRSPPERAKVKIPLVRQDIRRITAKMGIPMNPPPLTTDPTLAGIGSLFAEKQGLLMPYIQQVMHTEWAEGRDIGDEQVLLTTAEQVGLGRNEFQVALREQHYLDQLDSNWVEAQQLGFFGVPSFQVGDELFWGSDRVEYLTDYLRELRLKRF